MAIFIINLFLTDSSNFSVKIPTSETPKVKQSPKENHPQAGNNKYEDQVIYSPHHLAIIVPFRDRFEELQDFVPHMHKYLKEKGISFTIYIVNQADRHRYLVIISCLHFK